MLDYLEMSEKRLILGIKKFNFPLIEISLLIIIALGIRFIFFDKEIPLVLDSLTYFSFSYETTISSLLLIINLLSRFPPKAWINLKGKFVVEKYENQYHQVTDTYNFPYIGCIY